MPSGAGSDGQLPKRESDEHIAGEYWAARPSLAFRYGEEEAVRHWMS